MKFRKPEYFDRFQCIAGACSDSCCIGWEIDVDEDRRELYRGVEGELGERLKTCIDWEEGHFILQGKEERCPFLNRENLCDLIIGLGEDSLCDICREHPRYYDWFDDTTEMGVGLCCEAAAELIVKGKEPATFLTTGDGEEEDEFTEALFEARETAFSILQNRTVPFRNRLSCFLTYIEELQQALDFEDLNEVLESAEYYRNYDWDTEENPEQEEAGMSSPSEGVRNLLEICEMLEPIDESWPEVISGMKTMIQDTEQCQVLEKALNETGWMEEHEYENLAVYFVYRYFMKCREDGDIYSKGVLAVFCLLLIRLLDTVQLISEPERGAIDRVIHAKDCSKEIEYSEENLETLANLFWEDERISSDMLHVLL